MEDRKLFKKRIREFSKAFAKKYGFKHYKPTFLIRNRNNIIQTVCFDFPPGGMQAHIAMQPLYFPERFIHFSFGQRLNRFKTNESGLWGREEGRIDEDIDRISTLLEENVIPLFDEVYSPQTLIKYINSYIDVRNQRVVNGTERLADQYRSEMYLGFSYLYIKEYASAKIHLQKVIEELSAPRYINRYDNTNYYEKEIELVTTLINLIDDKRYEDIEKEMNGFIEKTKADCGITDLV